MSQYLGCYFTNPRKCFKPTYCQQMKKPWMQRGVFANDPYEYTHKPYVPFIHENYNEPRFRFRGMYMNKPTFKQCNRFH